MNYDDYYNALKILDPVPDGPSAWLQWKGTNACADLHCACGAQGHIDGYFLYYWRCTACGALYALSPNVRMIRLECEMRAYVETECSATIGEGDDAP